MGVPRGGSCNDRGSGGSTSVLVRWQVVVEEVQPATKTERVFILIVEVVALGFSPEVVRVLW